MSSNGAKKRGQDEIIVVSGLAYTTPGKRPKPIATQSITPQSSRKTPASRAKLPPERETRGDQFRSPRSDISERDLIPLERKVNYTPSVHAYASDPHTMPNTSNILDELPLHVDLSLPQDTETESKPYVFVNKHLQRTPQEGILPPLSAKPTTNGSETSLRSPYYRHGKNTSSSGRLAHASSAYAINPYLRDTMATEREVVRVLGAIDKARERERLHTETQSKSRDRLTTQSRSIPSLSTPASGKARSQPHSPSSCRSVSRTRPSVDAAHNATEGLGRADGSPSPGQARTSPKLARAPEEYAKRGAQVQGSGGDTSLGRSTGGEVVVTGSVEGAVGNREPREPVERDKKAKEASGGNNASSEKAGVQTLRTEGGPAVAGVEAAGAEAAEATSSSSSVYSAPSSCAGSSAPSLADTDSDTPTAAASAAAGSLPLTSAASVPALIPARALRGAVRGGMPSRQHVNDARVRAVAREMSEMYSLKHLLARVTNSDVNTKATSHTPSVSVVGMLAPHFLPPTTVLAVEANGQLVPLNNQTHTHTLMPGHAHASVHVPGNARVPVPELSSARVHLRPSKPDTYKRKVEIEEVSHSKNSFEDNPQIPESDSRQQNSISSSRPGMDPSRQQFVKIAAQNVLSHAQDANMRPLAKSASSSVLPSRSSAARAAGRTQASTTAMTNTTAATGSTMAPTLSTAASTSGAAASVPSGSSRNLSFTASASSVFARPHVHEYGLTLLPCASHAAKAGTSTTISSTAGTHSTTSPRTVKMPSNVIDGAIAASTDSAGINTTTNSKPDSSAQVVIASPQPHNISQSSVPTLAASASACSVSLHAHTHGPRSFPAVTDPHLCAEAYFLYRYLAELCQVPEYLPHERIPLITEALQHGVPSEPPVLLSFAQLTSALAEIGYTDSTFLKRFASYAPGYTPSFAEFAAVYQAHCAADVLSPLHTRTAAPQTQTQFRSHTHTPMAPSAGPRAGAWKPRETGAEGYAGGGKARIAGERMDDAQDGLPGLSLVSLALAHKRRRALEEYYQRHKHSDPSHSRVMSSTVTSTSTSTSVAASAVTAASSRPLVPASMHKDSARTMHHTRAPPAQPPDSSTPVSILSAADMDELIEAGTPLTEQLDQLIARARHDGVHLVRASDTSRYGYLRKVREEEARVKRELLEELAGVSLAGGKQGAMTAIGEIDEDEEQRVPQHEAEAEYRENGEKHATACNTAANAGTSITSTSTSACASAAAPAGRRLSVLSGELDADLLPSTTSTSDNDNEKSTAADSVDAEPVFPFPWLPPLLAHPLTALVAEALSRECAANARAGTGAAVPTSGRGVAVQEVAVQEVAVQGVAVQEVAVQEVAVHLDRGCQGGDVREGLDGGGVENGTDSGTGCIGDREATEACTGTGVRRVCEHGSSTSAATSCWPAIPTSAAASSSNPASAASSSTSSDEAALSAEAAAPPAELIVNQRGLPVAVAAAKKDPPELLSRASSEQLRRLLARSSLSSLWHSTLQGLRGEAEVGEVTVEDMLGVGSKTTSGNALGGVDENVCVSSNDNQAGSDIASAGAGACGDHVLDADLVFVQQNRAVLALPIDEAEPDTGVRHMLATAPAQPVASPGTDSARGHEADITSSTNALNASTHVSSGTHVLTSSIDRNDNAPSTKSLITPVHALSTAISTISLHKQGSVTVLTHQTVPPKLLKPPRRSGFGVKVPLPADGITVEPIWRKLQPDAANIEYYVARCARHTAPHDSTTSTSSVVSTSALAHTSGSLPQHSMTAPPQTQVGSHTRATDTRGTGDMRSTAPAAGASASANLGVGEDSVVLEPVRLPPAARLAFPVTQEEALTQHYQLQLQHTIKREASRQALLLGPNAPRDKASLVNSTPLIVATNPNINILLRGTGLDANSVLQKYGSERTGDGVASTDGVETVHGGNRDSSRNGEAEEDSAGGNVEEGDAEEARELATLLEKQQFCPLTLKEKLRIRQLQESRMKSNDNPDSKGQSGYLREPKAGRNGLDPSQREVYGMSSSGGSANTHENSNVRFSSFAFDDLTLLEDDRVHADAEEDEALTHVAVTSQAVQLLWLTQNIRKLILAYMPAGYDTGLLYARRAREGVEAGNAVEVVNRVDVRALHGEIDMYDADTAAAAGGTSVDNGTPSPRTHPREDGHLGSVGGTSVMGLTGSKWAASPILATHPRTPTPRAVHTPHAPGTPRTSTPSTPATRASTISASARSNTPATPSPSMKNTRSTTSTASTASTAKMDNAPIVDNVSSRDGPSGTGTLMSGGTHSTSDALMNAYRKQRLRVHEQDSMFGNFHENSQNGFSRPSSAVHDTNIPVNRYHPAGMRDDIHHADMPGNTQNAHSRTHHTPRHSHAVNDTHVHQARAGSATALSSTSTATLASPSASAHDARLTSDWLATARARQTLNLLVAERLREYTVEPAEADGRTWGENLAVVRDEVDPEVYAQVRAALQARNRAVRARAHNADGKANGTALGEELAVGRERVTLGEHEGPGEGKQHNIHVEENVHAQHNDRIARNAHVAQAPIETASSASSTTTTTTATTTAAASAFAPEQAHTEYPRAQVSHLPVLDVALPHSTPSPSAPKSTFAGTLPNEGTSLQTNTSLRNDTPVHGAVSLHSDTSLNGVASTQAGAVVHANTPVHAESTLMSADMPARGRARVVESNSANSSQAPSPAASPLHSDAPLHSGGGQLPSLAHSQTPSRAVSRATSRAPSQAPSRAASRSRSRSSMSRPPSASLIPFYNPATDPLRRVFNSKSTRVGAPGTPRVPPSPESENILRMASPGSRVLPRRVSQSENSLSHGNFTPGNSWLGRNFFPPPPSNTLTSSPSEHRGRTPFIMYQSGDLDPVHVDVRAMMKKKTEREHAGDMRAAGLLEEALALNESTRSEATQSADANSSTMNSTQSTPSVTQDTRTTWHTPTHATVPAAETSLANAEVAAAAHSPPQAPLKDASPPDASAPLSASAALTEAERVSLVEAARRAVTLRPVQNANIQSVVTVALTHALDALLELADSTDLSQRERCLRLALAAVNMASQRVEHYSNLRVSAQDMEELNLPLLQRMSFVLNSLLTTTSSLRQELHAIAREQHQRQTQEGLATSTHHRLRLRQAVSLLQQQRDSIAHVIGMAIDNQHAASTFCVSPSSAIPSIAGAPTTTSSYAPVHAQLSHDNASSFSPGLNSGPPTNSARALRNAGPPLDVSMFSRVGAVVARLTGAAHSIISEAGVGLSDEAEISTDDKGQPEHEGSGGPSATNGTGLGLGTGLGMLNKKDLETSKALSDLLDAELREESSRIIAALDVDSLPTTDTAMASGPELPLLPTGELMALPDVERIMQRNLVQAGVSAGLVSHEGGTNTNTTTSALALAPSMTNTATVSSPAHTPSTNLYTAATPNAIQDTSSNTNSSQSTAAPRRADTPLGIGTSRPQNNSTSVDMESKCAPGDVTPRHASSMVSTSNAPHAIAPNINSNTVTSTSTMSTIATSTSTRKGATTRPDISSRTGMVLATSTGTSMALGTGSSTGSGSDLGVCVGTEGLVSESSRTPRQGPPSLLLGTPPHTPRIISSPTSSPVPVRSGGAASQVGGAAAPTGSASAAFAATPGNNSRHGLGGAKGSLVRGLRSVAPSPVMRIPTTPASLQPPSDVPVSPFQRESNTLARNIGTFSTLDATDEVVDDVHEEEVSLAALAKTKGLFDSEVEVDEVI